MGSMGSLQGNLEVKIWHLQGKKMQQVVAQNNIDKELRPLGLMVHKGPIIG